MDPERRRTPLLIGLAIAIVVILVTGLAFWTARHRDDAEQDHRASGGWVGRVGNADDPQTAGGQADAEAATAQAPPTSGPLVDVTRANAADYIGALDAGTSVRFTADAATGRITGKVTDAAGTDLGPGTLRVGPGPTTYAAPAITLDGQIDVNAKEVVLTDVIFTATRGPLTVEGKGLAFQPVQQKGQPPPPERNLGDTKVTVSDGATNLDLGQAKRWEDAPATLQLRDPSRSTLSWEGGTGHVTGPGPDHEPITATRTLGVKADGLAATITRTPNQGLTIKGEGRLRQAYADALPRIPARGRVDVKTQPAPLTAGAKGRFTWAPTNTTDYDLAITRIRPGNDQGRWVNLALDQLPMMCGRPTCDRLGGATDGLGKKGSGGLFSGGAKPINCVILPRTGDERDITFDVPAGTPPAHYDLVLVLEGNFEPITVTIPVTVTA